MKYHPGLFEVLTLARYPGWGQCMVDVYKRQGYGCSPFKEVRELGLKRRETVWSLSAVGVGYLTEPAPSTRGPEWTYLWCTGCHANGIAG